MEPTEHPTDQPTPTQPRENRIMAEPATVKACAQDFSSGAGVRAQMAKQQILRRGLTTTLLAAAAVFALGACSSAAPTTKPTPSTAAAPTPAATPAADDLPAGIDKRELTAAAVQMTWAGSTEKAKDDMCAGVDLFGVDWAARQLHTGGGTNSELDWDYAAELIQAECALR